MSRAATLGLGLAERGLVPTALVRRGIRRLLRKRREELARKTAGGLAAHRAAWLAHMRAGPIADVPEVANEQHYEVPAAFFERVLGPALKYSSAWYATGNESLAEAETAMLDLTCERADVQDGMRVLDLGCGWGSFTLHAAARFPQATFLAVSNAAPQRACIEARAAARGLTNVRVQTADMNRFQPDETFDRIVSVEMFEHMRNWEALLTRIAAWLAPEGRLFLHTFVHEQVSYAYEDRGPADWMTRHFFGGGMMPAADLLTQLDMPLAVEAAWRVNGHHYARTAEAWVRRMDAQAPAIQRLLEETYGAGDGRRWFHRWRIFFLACAELWGHGDGSTWRVQHTRLRRKG